MNKIGSDITYSTKVWLASVVVSPFLLLFLIGAQEGYKGSLGDVFGFIFMAMAFGFLFSIPCWLTLMVASRTVYNLEYDEQKFKMIINIIAVVIALILFGLFTGGFYNTEGFIWSIPYIITLTIGIWYFKLSPKEIKRPSTIDHLID
jgi:hypothetical protein